MSAALPACVAGDRIRLIKMQNDPCPVPQGTTGHILGVSALGAGRYSISVAWDVPRSLALVWPQDRFEVI